MQKSGVIYSHSYVRRVQISVVFQAKRDNAKMTETGGGKEVKYNEMDLFILDTLGKDSPSVEGLEVDELFSSW